MPDLSAVLTKFNLHPSISLIFADCFSASLRKSPSLPNFPEIIKNSTNLTQTQLSDVYNLIFGIIAGLYKSLPSNEDFKTILKSINIEDTQIEPILINFNEFIDLIKIKRKGWESSLKIPDKTRSVLNEAISEEYLGIRFAEIVNLEWVGGQEICTSNLNKTGEIKFSFKLHILTNDFDTNVMEKREFSNEINLLKIKTIDFCCTQAELNHLLYQVSDALFEVNKFTTS